MKTICALIVAITFVTLITPIESIAKGERLKLKGVRGTILNVKDGKITVKDKPDQSKTLPIDDKTTYSIEWIDGGGALEDLKEGMHIRMKVGGTPRTVVSIRASAKDNGKKNKPAKNAGEKDK